MNHIKSAVCGLLLAIPIAYSNAAVTGTVILAKEDGSICTLPLPALPNTYIRYNFRRIDSPCSHFNDNVRPITFLDAPSATDVVLTNYEGTPKNGDTNGAYSQGPGDFIVTLKTTRLKTTTEVIQLDHLPSYKPEQMIKPGLQMKSIEFKSHLRDKLSCLSIKISGAPPTTP